MCQKAQHGEEHQQVAGSGDRPPSPPPATISKNSPLMGGCGPDKYRQDTDEEASRGSFIPVSTTEAWGGAVGGLG